MNLFARILGLAVARKEWLMTYPLPVIAVVICVAGIVISVEESLA